MKFSINRDHFVSGLQQVMNVVGTRATMPILGNVLIQAEKDRLELTTTNLDLGIRCSVRAEVTEAGALTLPVRKLHQIVRSLPKLDVEVESASANQAKISSGGSVFRITGIGREEFPPLPAFPEDQQYELAQEDLLGMLKSVSYARSKDETRYIMNSVFFSFGTGKLTLVATDGRRLAVIAKELDAVADDEAGRVTVPAKAIDEIERLLGQGEKVKIAFNERQVAFTIAADGEADTGLVDAIQLVSKAVEGNYPNYQQVIPKEAERHLKVEREYLLDCVQRASFVTSDRSKSIKMKITEGRLEVSGSSAEFGESHEPISINYEGPEVQVAFNPDFLLDPLRSLTDDEVTFEFKDELSPGVLKTTNHFTCVIMPLRLS